MTTLRLTTLALGLMVSGVGAQTYVVDRYQEIAIKFILNKPMQSQAKPATF